MNRRNFLLGSAATLTAAILPQPAAFNPEQTFQTFVEYFAERKFYLMNAPTLVQFNQIQDALTWTPIKPEDFYNLERMHSNG